MVSAIILSLEEICATDGITNGIFDGIHAEQGCAKLEEAINSIVSEHHFFLGKTHSCVILLITMIILNHPVINFTDIKNYK